MSKRPARPRARHSATVSQEAHTFGRPPRTWTGKAERKKLDAKVDSCEGSPKAPVTGCIAAAPATSRSGSSLLCGPSQARCAIPSAGAPS
eukprot:scaffold69559_cov54-Phaeocystis_antarctica.AAC.2